MGSLDEVGNDPSRSLTESVEGGRPLKSPGRIKVGVQIPVTHRVHDSL